MLANYYPYHCLALSQTGKPIFNYIIMENVVQIYVAGMEGKLS